MKPGDIVIADEYVEHMGWPMLWDIENSQSCGSFVAPKIGMIISVKDDNKYAKILTSTGATGWVLTALLVIVK